MHVENKRLIMLFGILFSVVFCLMYYVLFSFTLGKANDDKRTLYMNQVGLYEKGTERAGYAGKAGKGRSEKLYDEAG